MLTRIMWFLVMAHCEKGLDNKNLLLDIFGQPPSSSTEQTNAERPMATNGTIPTDTLLAIFGPPNATEVPKKGTISTDELFAIFEPPKDMEGPDKEKRISDLEAIFGKPETTTGSVKSDWPGAYVPCELQSKEKGICVPYYLCDVCTDLIIVDGKNILDVRVHRDCPDALLVCCLEANTQPKTDTLPLAEQNPTVDNGDVTDGPSEATPPSKKVPPQKTQCGRMQSNGLGVYINERKISALFGEFPWMVGVLSDESPSWDMTSYLGGGSLIGPRAVLTAAHTVLGRLREEVSLRVRAGEWETKSTSEMFPYIEASVEEGIVHDDFNPGTFYNDIALLILETPIERDHHIGYACLPPPDSIPPGPPTHCYSMGWGSPNEQSNEYAVFLKKIKMPIEPAEPCQKNLRTTYLSSQFKLHHSFICAGGKENQDSCFGDGGSPLVCPIPGEKHRSAQVGIVAYGVGCGKGHPGLYTNVANFRRWVDKKMGEKKLDTNTYSY